MGMPSQFTQTAASVLENVGSMTKGAACSVVPAPAQSSSQTRCPLTFRVTGIFVALPPVAVMWIMPEYLPAERLAGFTETVIIPGAVPEAGLSESQAPPEVDAVKAMEPLLKASVRFCEGGMAPPACELNVSSDGVTVKALAPVAGLTVRLTVVVCVRLPEAPVMVNPTVRLAALLLAESVRVLVPAPLTGLKEAVTPEGKPGGAKLTVAGLKPPDGVIVMVLVRLEPGEMVRLLGEAERLKFGAAAAVTVRLTVVV